MQRNRGKFTGDRESVIAATERFGSLTMLMSSLEQLTNKKNRATGGLNDWQVLRGAVPRHYSVFRTIGDRVYRGRNVEVLHVTRAFASAISLLPVRHRGVRTAAGAVNVATTALLAPLHHNGGDGSDQASFATQAVAIIARASRNEAVQEAALWTVAGQAILAYSASGWVKLVGQDWRSNEAIRGVMRTRTYGSPAVFRVVDKYPVLSRIGEVVTLAMECGYPIVYFVSPNVRRGYIASIGGLHVSIAVVMGLGRFVPAFFSLQPAVLYTADQIRAGKRINSGHLLPALAFVSTAVVAASVYQQHRDRIGSRALGTGQALIDLPSGSRLAVRYLDHADPSAPLLVFENSLVATQEYWDPIIAHLRDRFAVLTYNRPGYGASETTAQPLGSYTDDLTALIARYRGDRRVWAVGHSIGGYLLWSRRTELGSAVRGFVLLDPTVDNYGANDDALTDRAAPLEQSLREIAVSLRTGWGNFLTTDTWDIPALGDNQPEQLPSIYRNSRIWSAGLAEWKSVINGFDRQQLVGADTGHEVVVVSAAGMRLHNDKNAAAHKRIAESVGGRHLQLSATHDGLLVHPAPAKAVGDVIAELAGQRSGRG